MTDNIGEAFPDAERLEVHQDVTLANATSNQSPLSIDPPHSRGVEDLIHIATWVTHGT